MKQHLQGCDRHGIMHFENLKGVAKVLRQKFEFYLFKFKKLSFMQKDVPSDTFLNMSWQVSTER